MVSKPGQNGKGYSDPKVSSSAHNYGYVVIGGGTMAAIIIIIIILYIIIYIITAQHCMA